MKYKIFLFIIFLPLIIVAQSPSDVLNNISNFEPFIGDWYTIPDSTLLQQFPETKDMIGFRFEWEDARKKTIKYYEGIPEGKLEKHILGATIAPNPRTGELEFLGYQMRNDFLFKGSFSFQKGGKELLRKYDVYYPYNTKFSNPEDSLKGMITYRDVCKLKGKDTLECLVERLNNGSWKPWGNGLPFSMVRKTIPARPIPDWVRKNWEAHTRGTGIWITDNSKYKSEQEPYDAYGMEWEWGLGESSMKGSLYCIRDGKDMGTVWQFMNYWDPETQQEKMIQIGSNGVIGKGSLALQDDGSTKSQELFISPDGGSFKAGHHSWFEDDKMHTQSYDIINDKWSKRRFYIWEPYSISKNEIPEEYTAISWLIGEWKSSFGERSASMRFAWAENQRMIKYENGYTVKAGEPETLESEGIITYHGIKDQVIFMNTYLQNGGHLISEGYYDIKDNGVIHRLFTCHYKEGDKLPWSNGARAKKGGKSIEFKQIWTPIDENSFSGEFYWKKNGKWENPIKDRGPDHQEIWKRK